MSYLWNTFFGPNQKEKLKDNDMRRHNRNKRCYRNRKNSSSGLSALQTAKEASLIGKEFNVIGILLLK